MHSNLSRDSSPCNQRDNTTQACSGGEEGSRRKPVTFIHWKIVRKKMKQALSMAADQLTLNGRGCLMRGNREQGSSGMVSPGLRHAV